MQGLRWPALPAQAGQRLCRRGRASQPPPPPPPPTTAGAVALPAQTARPASAIREIRRALLSRERSAVEVARQYLAATDALEPRLGSFLHVAREALLDGAAAVDRALAEGAELGPLAGVPLGVKDNFCTSDMPSTGGSRVLEGYRPPYDATSVRRLRAAGALVLGKTNLDEFGMGSTTEGSAYQVTSNPWDTSRVPGGSSGGSAAAVAAGQVAIAVGSDTGGSVRQPASFCGVVGLKPTYGRISRHGLMAYASSLDVVGCLSTCVEDAALMLSVMAGHDSQDATSSKRDVPNYAASLPQREQLDDKPLAGTRLGLIMETVEDGVSDDVLTCINKAISHLEDLGACVSKVSLPSFASGLPAYYILAPSEASSNLARYDGVRYGPRGAGDELVTMYCNSRGSGFGSEVKRRILMGTYALSAGYYDAFYKRSQQVRTLVQRDYLKALQDNDALLSPVAPTPAYAKGDKVEDPLSMYVGDLMTVNVNLAGLPAVTVPCGLAPGGQHGLPVGLQLIGAAFQEEGLLRLAHIFEQTTPTWSSGLLSLQS
eukprot:SM000101S09266  [mRNA]  locus=s101:284060:288694:- [translate_table: standard]